MLLTIGSRIASSDWDKLSKQVIWAACCVAFFASARFGELLASHPHRHDPSCDLLWGDVKFVSDSSILIRLKSPKSGEKDGEFLDLFSFTGYNCCPVASLRALKEKSVAAGLGSADSPVFRFRSGANLTQQHLNKTLAELLSDICVPGSDTISCHSFRAGLPTILTQFPDIAGIDDVKSWGRWRSDCYTSYTRLRHSQKEQIFGKITSALVASYSQQQ